MDMFKLLATVIFFNVYLSITFAQYGIKGGGRQQQFSNETGYCYKRIPYHQAQSLYNESYPAGGYGQGIRPHWNSTERNSGWITVLDCCEGYSKNPSTGRCESRRNNCENGCFGGACINGVCTCDNGWYALEGVCKPICRHQCQENAYCFAPDICECKFGWEQLPTGECRAICPGGCINGDCIAPNVCQCRSGYLLNEPLRRCHAICEGGCPHGECTSPGVCTCNQGYVNPRYDRESCIPDCGAHNCNGGQCISPGVCLCQPGYTKDSSNNCIPECRNTCPINAECIFPEQCVCKTGYQMDYQNNRCVSLRGGTNQHGQFQTVPGNYPETEDCQRPCINGVCMGHNICSCNNGYVQDPQDQTRTRCIPMCPGGCPNGTCSGPNFCICKPGYIKDRSVKGSQRCIPRHDYY